MFSRLLLAMALVGVANAQYDGQTCQIGSNPDCSDTEKIAAVCDCASPCSGAGDGTVGSYCISNTVYTLCVLNDVLGEACACPSSDESTASASGFVANVNHVCKAGADASTVGIFVACVGSKGCTGTDVCSTGAGTAPNNVCQSIGSDDGSCAKIDTAKPKYVGTACVACATDADCDGTNGGSSASTDVCSTATPNTCVAAGSDNATCAAIDTALPKWVTVVNGPTTVGACVACATDADCDGTNGGSSASTDVCSTATPNTCVAAGRDNATCAAISDAAAHWDATTSACVVAQQACSADSSNGVCTGGTVKDANGTCATGTCGAADFGDDTKACCKTEFSPSSPASAPSSASAPSPSESEMDEETFVFLLSAGKMAGTNVFHAALTFVVAVWAVAC